MAWPCAKVVIYEAFVEGKLEALKPLARVTVHDLDRPRLELQSTLDGRFCPRQSPRIVALSPGQKSGSITGSSRGGRSATRNRVLVTMVEINLEPRASAEQEVPVSYNGFAFVIDGSV